MYQRKEPELIKKLRLVKNCFERFYVILVCILWIIATCWDIYKLQRYWFDYALELYSTFIIFITLLYSLSPKAISSNIYKLFKIITKIKGRGTIFIIVSLLFVNDNHDFHRFSSFVLLIAGVLCFVCELLIPTTKEELDRIEEFYGKNIDKNNNDIAIFNKDNNKNIDAEKYDTSENNENNENINNDIEKNVEKVIEIKSENDIASEEQNIQNIKNELANNQSTNPYDLPDDF